MLERLASACGELYGARLKSLAVYGSVGRGTPRADSDVDILVVADPLPDGRIARVNEFSSLERKLEASLKQLRDAGFQAFLSPIFKTPAEFARGSLLFLDMIDEARILFDRDGFLRRGLDDLQVRLDRLGARRVWNGTSWYWDLKPDYKPGETFEI